MPERLRGTLRTVDALMRQLRTLLLALLAGAGLGYVLPLPVADAGIVVIHGPRGGTSSPTAPPPSSNLNPPTDPTAISAVVADNLATFRAWQSVSHHDGTNAGPGVTQYRVRQNGAQQSPITAPSTNILPAPSTANVGSISPAPTFTRIDGVDWTLTAAGTGGHEGTSDQVGYLYWGWASGYVASARVAAFTSPDSGTFPGQYGMAGVECRETTAAADATEEFIFVGYVASVGVLNRGGFVKWRTSAGGAVSQVYWTGDGSLGSLHIEHVTASTWRVWSQADGGAMVLRHTITDVSFSSATCGVSLNSLTSNAANATFRQIAVRTATPVAYDVSGTSNNTVEFAAVDANSHVSGYSVAVTAAGSSGPPPPTSGVKKWRPGYYMRVDSVALNANRSIHAARWDVALANSNFKGGLIIIPWGSVNPSSGSYNWAEIDYHRNYLCRNGNVNGTDGAGKAIILEPWWHKFSASVDSNYIPQDIVTAGHWFTYAGYYTGAMMSHPYVRARWIEFINAVAARYDDDPCVEMFAITETNSFDDDNDSEGGAYETSFYAFADTLAAGFQHTNVTVWNNYYVSPAATRSYQEYLRDRGLGVGAPDLRSGNSNEGDWGSDAYDGSDGGEDLRGQVPAAWNFEGAAFELTNLVNAFSIGVSGSNSILGGRGRFNTHFPVGMPYEYNNPAYTESAVLAAVAANPIQNTACPTTYDGCDTNPFASLLEPKLWINDEIRELLAGVFSKPPRKILDEELVP